MATHGIVKTLRSDNGPCFSSSEFKQFCKSYVIEHNTSSSHFQSSNGEAERAIQTVKRMWNKSSDKQLALLDYRTTPLEGINLSPSQLLMGRRLRNTLPMSKELLKPSTDNTESVKKHFNLEKDKHKFYCDHKRGVKELPPFDNGTNIRMSLLPRTKSWVPGTVVEPYGLPRLYIVKHGNRVYRRNRKHLKMPTESANRELEREPDISDRFIPSTTSNTSVGNGQQLRSEETPRETSTGNGPGNSAVKSPATNMGKSPIRTRSGRAVKPPQRLDM